MKDKSYNLSLSANVVQIIWSALHKAPLPRESTDIVLVEMQRQMAEQDKDRDGKAD